MNEQKFWKLIETAKERSQGDMKEQIRLLAFALAELDVPVILEFSAIYMDKEDQVYKVEIWDAAHLLGVYGDDGFIDFRDWLICQGEAVYYAALNNPDCLAYLFDENSKPFDCEEMMIFVAILEAFEMKTGERELPPIDGNSIRDLVDDFREGEELIKKYPKLAALSERWYGWIWSNIKFYL